MTPLSQSLAVSLASAVRMSQLARENRDSACRALAQHVRDRMKAARLTPVIVCERLGWTPAHLTNFLNLNYILHDNDLTRLLDIIEVRRTHSEAIRFSRSQRLKEARMKRENQNP